MFSAIYKTPKIFKNCFVFMTRMPPKSSYDDLIAFQLANNVFNRNLVFCYKFFLTFYTFFLNVPTCWLSAVWCKASQQDSSLDIFIPKYCLFKGKGRCSSVPIWRISLNCPASSWCPREPDSNKTSSHWLLITTWVWMQF